MADDTPNQRLRNNLKSPYPDTDGTNWGALVETFASEFAVLESSRKSVLESVAVDKASGAQLGKIGELVRLDRKTGETDPHYRGRLKVQLKKFTGGASIKEIKEVAAILLQTDTKSIKIDEDFDVEAARFVIGIPSSDLENTGVTVGEFKEFIDEVRGAGINTVAQQRGTFTYRSEQDYSNSINDSSKGYKDPGDGIENGTYAGLL